ncbi:MAG: hypothetical protein ACLU9S_13525 [Oscillospiraceae bacterium]
MSLEGIWPVHEDGRQVGTCTVARQGLYLRFDCRRASGGRQDFKTGTAQRGGDVSRAFPRRRKAFCNYVRNPSQTQSPQVDEFRLELLIPALPVPAPEPAPIPEPEPEPEPVPTPEPVPSRSRNQSRR